MEVHMNEIEAKKLALDLLREYGDVEILEDGIGDCCDYCKPVFISNNLFWHTIYIRTSAGDFSRRKALKGKNIVEVVSAIWKTLKDGGSLESDLKNGDYVVIKLGTEAGAVEKFLLECELKNAVK